MIEGEIWKELVGFDITKELGPAIVGRRGWRGRHHRDAAEAGQGDPDNIRFSWWTPFAKTKLSSILSRNWRWTTSF